MKLSYLKNRLDCEHSKRIKRLNNYVKTGKATTENSKYAKIYEFNNITDKLGNKRPIKMVMYKETGNIEAYLL